MSYFEAKEYQQQVLDSVSAYFHACHVQNPSMAFYEMTGVSYHALKGILIVSNSLIFSNNC